MPAMIFACTTAPENLWQQHRIKGSILQFYGFDTGQRQFYYRGTYNWRYWGYDHDMASLMAGNVGEDNTLHLPEANLMMLYQSYFYERNKPAEMLNDKYLAVLNTFQSPNAITILIPTAMITTITRSRVR